MASVLAPAGAIAAAAAAGSSVAWAHAEICVGVTEFVNVDLFERGYYSVGVRCELGGGVSVVRPLQSHGGGAAAATSAALVLPGIPPDPGPGVDGAPRLDMHGPAAPGFRTATGHVEVGGSPGVAGSLTTNLICRAAIRHSTRPTRFALTLPLHST